MLKEGLYAPALLILHVDLQTVASAVPADLGRGKGKNPRRGNIRCPAKDLGNHRVLAVRLSLALRKGFELDDECTRSGTLPPP